MTEEQICEKLQQVLKPGRYRHTLGVADTAERMATVWHVSPAQARLAGLLHDCGKEAGDALSHGPIGARLACTDYGVTDEEILRHRLPYHRQASYEYAGQDYIHC